jgi:Uma2 family endonuclease
MIDYSPDLAPAKQIMTAAEYFAAYPEETNLPQELLEGEVFIMPAPFDDHQRISTYLNGFLFPVIVLAELGELRASPTDVQFDAYNVVQPDILFIAKDSLRCVLIEGGKRWQGAPDLCIEILSPSTAKRDMEAKFALYERQGVREYWVVDAANRYVSVYSWIDGRFVRQGVYGPDDSLNSPLLPGLSLPLKQVFGKD